MNVTLPLLTLVLFAVTSRAGLERKTVMVEGVAREYLISVPSRAASGASPLVFIFHGHGGSAEQAARSFGIHMEWPAAVCVYMQGLPTVGRLTDPEGKRSGWQAGAGDQGDRDLHFFDETLKAVPLSGRVDASRIYATGHSNGGGFTYLLAAERPRVFAAIAPSGAAAIRTLAKLTPRPVLHIVGRNDPLVKFAWQKVTMDGVLRINDCEPTSIPWEGARLFRSSRGTPMAQYVHNEGHKFPRAAPALIVGFFKHHALPAGGY
jgi:polyhydroxybutyrate depolymerase